MLASVHQHMVDLRTLAMSVVLFDGFADGGNLHEIRSGADHRNNFNGHRPPRLSILHRSRTATAPPTWEPKKTHRGAARTYPPSLAGCDNDGIASATEPRLWAGRDRFPRDGGIPSPADFLFR